MVPPSDTASQPRDPEYILCSIWHSDTAAQGRSRPSATGGGCLLDPIVLSESAIATILLLLACVIISSCLSSR
ncbi:hypothetical protein BO85DRAFT_131717 [Aspergillus piperis CBS 112811]|uniref:Uncharacterized protein n=1 Tax=Aspergillus piperis CBS 112811 TaxID=1448313 RepID=A0A8G1RD97_9EURO|nr:hypothetical protein BO85DRAFT_131717 [Aspergillus piperis CBS 112811]RAH62325.1 hypothetical protein BO85DRAFT_131717 [Aspergillus piperis CBS 112811]